MPAAAFLAALCLALPVLAANKLDMPCLSQEEQTCLPTATANVIVWFGLHGYPNLIQKGDNADDGYIHTVHALMTAVHATYQFGTDNIAITYGIQKYIRDAGYSADVEYRGVDWSSVHDKDIFEDADYETYKKAYRTPAPFTQDWLQTNDDPSKAFILLVMYTKYNPDTCVFSDPLGGHAVTLVSATPDTIVIHNPANDAEYPGQVVVTPTVLTGGSFSAGGFNASTTGLMLLDATEDEWPREGDAILLTGAVCITMHPNSHDASIVKGTVGSGPGPVASMSPASPGNSSSNGSPSSPNSTPSAAPAPSTNRSWAMWLFDFFFKS